MEQSAAAGRAACAGLFKDIAAGNTAQVPGQLDAAGGQRQQGRSRLGACSRAPRLLSSRATSRRAIAHLQVRSLPTAGLPQPYRDAALDPPDRARIRPAPAAGCRYPAAAAGQAWRALVRQRGRDDCAGACQAGQEARRPVRCSRRSPRTRPFPTTIRAPRRPDSPHRSASTSAARFQPRPSRTDMSKTETFPRCDPDVAAALAASGCGVFKKGKDPRTPVLGQRIAGPDRRGRRRRSIRRRRQLPMTLPEPIANTDWTQSGGNADQVDGSARARQQRLPRAFTVQAGRGSSLTARLAAAPIVANGRVYVIDTLGTVARLRRAGPARNSGPARRRPRRAMRASLYGGGIAYDSGAYLRDQRPWLRRRARRAQRRHRSGRCGRAARCAARRRSPTAPST